MNLEFVFTYLLDLRNWIHIWTISSIFTSGTAIYIHTYFHNLKLCLFVVGLNMYYMVLRLVLNIGYKTTLKNKESFNKDYNILKSRTLVLKGSKRTTTLVECQNTYF